MYICIEWCVYVCGFRGSHVDDPLAKQLQQKHLSVVSGGSCTPPKLADAKIKPFIFFLPLEPVYQHTAKHFAISLQIKAILILTKTMYLSRCLFSPAGMAQ